MSVDAVIAEFLADSDLEWEAGASEGEVVVTLPGEKKLRTVVSLVTSPTWLIARAALSDADASHCALRYYRAIPEYIAGYGILMLQPG